MSILAGMAVAEIICGWLSPNQEPKLKFSYDSTEIFDELKALTSPPTIPGMQAYRITKDREIKDDAARSDTETIVEDEVSLLFVDTLNHPPPLPLSPPSLLPHPSHVNNSTNSYRALILLLKRNVQSIGC